MSQPPARTSNLRIHRWLALLVALLLISSLGALFARDTSAAQPAPPVATPARVAGDAQRSPAISFIQSPSPTCYVAAPGSGACYIQWHYLYVEATPGSNIISMTVAIDDRLRTYASGFFQSTMYIPGEMIDPGLKVTCAEIGVAGAPTLGATYDYTIRARDSSGQNSANYGSVSCPVDIATMFLPLIGKR